MAVFFWLPCGNHTFKGFSKITLSWFPHGRKKDCKLKWSNPYLATFPYPSISALCVTTLLTLCTLWTRVNFSLPLVSYFKALDWYFLVSFVFILLVLVEYTIVVNVDTSREKKKVKNAKKEEKVSEVIFTITTLLCLIGRGGGKISRWGGCVGTSGEHLLTRWSL